MYLVDISYESCDQWPSIRFSFHRGRGERTTLHPGRARCPTLPCASAFVRPRLCACRTPSLHNSTAPLIHIIALAPTIRPLARAHSQFRLRPPYLPSLSPHASFRSRSRNRHRFRSPLPKSRSRIPVLIIRLFPVHYVIFLPASIACPCPSTALSPICCTTSRALIWEHRRALADGVVVGVCAREGGRTGSGTSESG